MKAVKRGAKPAAEDRKTRYSWKPTGVANVYMRVGKYYYVKMSEGKRHFTLLADERGKPVAEFPQADFRDYDDGAAVVG